MYSYRDSTVKMICGIYLFVFEKIKRFSVSQTAGNVIVDSNMILFTGEEIPTGIS